MVVSVLLVSGANGNAIEFQLILPDTFPDMPVTKGFDPGASSHDEARMNEDQVGGIWKITVSSTNYNIVIM